MYDVVVVGKGLSGMLAAIWARETGRKVALVTKGSGKIVQSSGVMELFPGNPEQKKDISLEKLRESINKFKGLMERLGYPYNGNYDHPVPIVTGAGYVKKGNLYPETITQVPEKGHVMIVGFDEIMDFQPEYIKGNLLKSRESLTIDTMSVRLGKGSLRTMTQHDAARILDRKENRAHVINQIKANIEDKNTIQPELFIFPSALGIENWKTVLAEFQTALGAQITEAPGMPPNATAIRLYQALQKEAVKLGVRFYNDTAVVGCNLTNNEIHSLAIINNKRKMEVKGKGFIIATGGVLGGGLEITEEGLKETVLQLPVDSSGKYVSCPHNVFPVGASLGTTVTNNGVTGALFSILSSYEAIEKYEQLVIERMNSYV